MNEELQEKLFKDYPEIFKDKDLPESETCMCHGIESKDGWFDLIDTLCHELQWMTSVNKYPQVVATSVKQKCGYLDFNFRIEESDGNKQNNGSRSADYLGGMVSFAQTMSKFICEECGAIGKPHGSVPSISVRCNICLEKLGDFQVRRPSEEKIPVWKC